MPLNYAVPDLKHRYPAEERGMSFWKPPNTATLNTRTIITELEVSIAVAAVERTRCLITASGTHLPHPYPNEYRNQHTPSPKLMTGRI